MRKWDSSSKRMEENPLCLLCNPKWMKVSRRKETIVESWFKRNHKQLGQTNWMKGPTGINESIRTLWISKPHPLLKNKRLGESYGLDYGDRVDFHHLRLHTKVANHLHGKTVQKLICLLVEHIGKDNKPKRAIVADIDRVLNAFQAKVLFCSKHTI